MMFVIIRASLFVLLVLLAIVFISCRFSAKKRNAHNDTPEKVVQAYLAAMATADQTQIKRLLAPKYNFTAALGEKIEQYGGIKLENVHLEYQPTESSHFFIVQLHADGIQRDGNRQVVEDTLHVAFKKNCWFIVLGKPIGLPPPVPDSPSGYAP